MKTVLLCQVLLSFTCEGEGPVRFGFPLPADRITRGLRVSDAGARLQWRPLQERPDPRTGRLWVGLAVTGARGAARILAGGAGPREDDGEVLRREVERRRGSARTVRVRRRCWSTGERDVETRVLFHARTEHESGEVFAAGEALTTCSAEWHERWLRVRIPAREWRRAGVLPRGGRGGRAFRRRLAALARELPGAPGLRGRGDFVRGRGTITNLEYDTTLGFALLGLAEERADLLRRALEAARHLVDRDLDRASGLPFRHGPGHRGAAAEPGHCWLAGLLLVGCLSADRDLIGAARSMARGLARHRHRGRGRRDRARDVGWPLLELETWLRFEDDAAVRDAADALALGLRSRWDPRGRVLRFGEGETRGRVYRDRTWITAGILVPALRAHLRRTRSAPVRELLGALERRVLGLVLQGRPGLPLQCWLADGGVFRQARGVGRAEGFFVLEGVPRRALARCLRRASVRAALRDAPPRDDPDLATSFSIAARCGWLYR